MCSAGSASPGNPTVSVPLRPASRWVAGTSVAAFMVPALALWLPSGYSWGAVLLLLLALLSLHRWPRQTVDAGSWQLVAALLAMGLVWLLQADPQAGSARWDRFSKFLLAVPCLLYALAYAPRPPALLLGIGIGCFGAAGIASWQVWGEGLARAHGYTNAIQFGNLALLLGVLAALQLIVRYEDLQRGARLALGLAVGLALHASALSLTRGGWLALLWLPLLLVPIWQFSRRGAWRDRVWLWCAALTLLLVPLFIKLPELGQRLELVNTEVAAYQQQGQAGTSIGHRLEHWRLAWHLGQRKPWWGWGDAGYKQEKERLVEQGRFDASTTSFDHAHNEVLDLFAKRGLVGVGGLLAFYAVPLVLFWPGRRRMQRWRDAAGLTAAGRMVLTLRLAGAATVLMYVGFGWTQVFFAHNSGVMFYVFMLLLCWAALRGIERRPDNRTLSRTAA